MAPGMGHGDPKLAPGAIFWSGGSEATCGHHFKAVDLLFVAFLVVLK